jgi:flavorubredoxin
MNEEIVYDYDDPVEVSKNIYWVGYHDEKQNLHCNPYLIIDGDISILIDPGPITHFPTVARKVVSLTNLDSISAIILHNHNPDVCGSVPVFEEVIGRKNLKIVTSEISRIYVQHYGLVNSITTIEDLRLTFKLKDRIYLDFIPTPFLCSPGNFVSYHRNLGILFSSDLFGGYSTNWQIFAGEEYLSQFLRFHQELMPSKTILNDSIKKIKNLRLKMIAPHHGSVIQQMDIQFYLSQLDTVKCGRNMKK